MGSYFGGSPAFRVAGTAPELAAGMLAGPGRAQGHGLATLGTLGDGIRRIGRIGRILLGATSTQGKTGGGPHGLGFRARRLPLGKVPVSEVILVVEKELFEAGAGGVDQAGEIAEDLKTGRFAVARGDDIKSPVEVGIERGHGCDGGVDAIEEFDADVLARSREDPGRRPREKHIGDAIAVEVARWKGRAGELVDA